MELMRFKLKNMEDHFNRDDIMIKDSYKVAKDIKICRILAERLVSRDYLKNALYWHHKKYGDKYHLNEGFFQRLDNGCSLYIGDQNIERKEDFRKWSDHSEYMIKSDLDMLCRYIRKYLFTWWD